MTLRPLALAIFSLAASASAESHTDVPYRAAPSDEYAARRCVLDIQTPDDTSDETSADRPATVVWFHGGGLTSGGKEIPEGLKDRGLIVVAANYRLAPRVPVEMCLDDAAAAVAWTLAHIADYGGDPDRVFVSGHSAGGYLTSMIGLDRSLLASYDANADRLAGLIPLSGHTITHFTAREQRGIEGTQPIVDALAPLYHLRADCPPILLITGDREKEMLARYEENAYLWRMLTLVEHPDCELFELEGFDHGGMADAAMPLVVAFVRERVQRMNRGE